MCVCWYTLLYIHIDNPPARTNVRIDVCQPCWPACVWLYGCDYAGMSIVMFACQPVWVTERLPVCVHVCLHPVCLYADRPVFVPMCVWMYACVCICICGRVHCVCMRVYMHMWVRWCLCVRRYVYMCVYVCVSVVSMPACVDECICVWLCGRLHPPCIYLHVVCHVCVY